MKEKYIKGALIFGIGILLVLCVSAMIWFLLNAAGMRIRQDSVKEENLIFSDYSNPVKGSKTAPIVVRIFSDLQCPACSNAEPGLVYAMQQYGDRVRFVWNDFPLSSVHRNALNAANAARCAEEQGMFWQFINLLFQKQPEWSDVATPAYKFKTYATVVKMNLDEFDRCVSTNKFQENIQNDQQEGDRNRVQSTPTFFINNIRHTGAMSKEEWDRLLQSVLNGV